MPHTITLTNDLFLYAKLLCRSVNREVNTIGIDGIMEGHERGAKPIEIKNSVTVPFLLFESSELCSLKKKEKKQE